MGRVSYGSKQQPDFHPWGRLKVFSAGCCAEVIIEMVMKEFSLFLTWWRSHFLDCCQMQNSLGPDVESHHPLMPHRPNGSGNPSVIRNELSSSWWRLKTPNPATPTGLLCPRIYGELPHPSLCFSQQSYETGSTGMIVPIIWMQRLGFRNAKWSA